MRATAHRHDHDGRNLLVPFAINALALVVAAYLVSGIHIEGWGSYAVTAIALGAVNAVARPFLKMLSCPLILLTLGAFLLVLHTAMLGLAAWIAGEVGADVRIDGFWAAFWGALIISLVSWALSRAFA